MNPISYWLSFDGQENPANQTAVVSPSVVSDCDPINCSTPGLPVLHYLLEFAQTHAHWVDDAIQSSHPLPPFSFAFSVSEAWVGFCHQVAKVLALQHKSFSEYSGLISFRIDLLDLLTLRETPKSLLQHHNSKASILWHSNINTWLLEKPQLWLYGPLLAKWYLCFLICCIGVPEFYFQGASIF